MEKVLNQAELLAEAILESEEYINMRLTEQAVMKDEEATLLVANYSEKRSKVEELLANPNMDRGELAKAGQELQEAEHMLDHNKLIAKMQETNDAFTDMMKKVNKIIKKVVTGEDEEEEDDSHSSDEPDDFDFSNVDPNDFEEDEDDEEDDEKDDKDDKDED